MSHTLNRREFLVRLLQAAGGISLTGCRPTHTPEPQPEPGDLAEITVLHVNDLHGALYPKPEEGGERGGAANLVGLIAHRRSEATGPVLLLDAGDAFQGTLISNSNQGQAVVEIMNLAGVDAMVPGNHEFDWGLDALRARIQQARYPFLAANLEDASGDALGDVLPYVVLNAGGIAVGVLGLTYHDMRTIVKASALEGLRSLSPVQTARRYLPELRRQSDLVIVLSHLGSDGDSELARAVPEIPLIIGGHSHQALETGRRVGDTLIVQAGVYGGYLGEVRLQFDPAQKRVARADTRLIDVTDAAPSDAQAEAIVARWAETVEEIGARIIGQAAVRLVHQRGAESPLGDLIVDAMRGADLGDGVAFDIALHNDGGIRADVDAGPVTYAEMYAVLPFDNNLVGLDLTGAQVKEMIESGVNNQGSEIQVSGARFVYSLNKSAGRRVMEVTVGSAPLDLERTYRVATIDYLYTHPQYEDSLGQGTNVFYGGLCLDAVVDYIKAHSPVEPQTEGRIRKM